MNLKVLIYAINSKYIHSALAPWCLSKAINDNCKNVQCKVIEGTINETLEKHIDVLKNESFDLIGFCTYIWNVDLVNELCEQIKKDREVITVLGGPEVSYNIKEHIMKPYVDYVISGEGEIPFSKLCDGIHPSQIDGVSYKENGQLFISEAFVSKSLSNMPYTEEYLENLHNRIAYIETSRGCPNRCSYCLSGRCGNVKFFDIEEAKNNIVLLANSGTKTIKFVDRTFNVSKKRADEIFRFIIENYGKKLPQGVCFHFEIDGSIIDEETIEILKDAPQGSIQLEIGIQSFNESTLKSINRRNNLEKLVENIRALVELGNIHIHIDLIVGLPYENIESLEQSFNKAYMLKAQMLQLGFLKILHGSDIENIAIKEYEYSKSAPYQIISNPWITREEMEKIHTCEHFFDKIYNSGRFQRTCDYIVSVYKNPFQAFMDFSNYASTIAILNSLDDLTKAVYEYFAKVENVDKNRLRDLLVMDRLSTNQSGAIPEFLKIHSPLIKAISKKLDESESTRRKKGIKRAISLLSDMKKFVYVDYDMENPVNKQFLLYEKDINNI